MTRPIDTTAATQEPPPRSTPTNAAHWQPLPARARGLLQLSHAAGFGILALGVGIALTVLASSVVAIWMAASLGFSVLVIGIFFGVWLGGKRHANTAWMLGRDGFGLRRGRLWFSDIRVPLSRVQHLDLKRGPLERRRDLATLVIHTAGSREHAVSVPCLDLQDAEQLRDALARASGLTPDDDDA